MKNPPFVVGDKVYCTVHGAEGWTTVLAIRPRDGYIKIEGFKSWCPYYNFTKTPKKPDLSEDEYRALVDAAQWAVDYWGTGAHSPLDTAIAKIEAAFPPEPKAKRFRITEEASEPYEKTYDEMVEAGNDPGTLETLQKMALGGTMIFGGGAAPMVRVLRIQ